MTQRFNSLNARNKQGGFSAVHHQDFLAHTDGGDFRHTAGQIDVTPLELVNGETVQEVLSQITDLITASGSGFISIGNVDGYATGSYNVGTVATPTLKDAFDAAFQDDRLTDGGVILILAGKYKLSSTVTVPPGITIMGEIGGTMIVGETTEQSLFTASNAVKSTNINGDSGSGDVRVSRGSNIEKIKFFNLILADNIDGYVASGGPSMTTVPMISVNKSANVEIDNVTFLGRLADGTTTNRAKTWTSVSTNNSGGSFGTVLTVKNCYIDGVALGIVFGSSLGELDSLTVTNNRCRFYGSENAGNSDYATNSFILATTAHAQINNNYVVGAGAYASTFLGLLSGGGSEANCRLVVTGNTGTAATATGRLIRTSGLDSVYIINHGNIWGKEYNNPWYLIVGGTRNSMPHGDISGSSAIDTILSMSSSGGFDGTVIVNPGTYDIIGTISSNNFSNIKFIGNKRGREYPIFNLNLASTSTDLLSNRYLTLGNHLESIKFTSAVSFHSIRPAFNPTSKNNQSPGHNIIVKDCIFNNTSLFFLEIGNNLIRDADGVDAKLNITVEDCEFRQTGVFTDNVSLVAPRVHNFTMRNCQFNGYGYATNLGDDCYSLNNNIYSPIYNIENTVWNLSGYTIDDSAPGSFADSVFLYINDSRGIVNINNCIVTCEYNNSSSSSVVNNTLLTSGEINKFVYIVAATINISNSIFNGPYQNFTLSSVEYALPTVLLSPRQDCNLVSNKFMGMLPLQISGTSVFADTTNAGSININGNSFLLHSTAGRTFLAIDTENRTARVGKISINNNNFEQVFASLTSSYRPVYNYNVNTSVYNAAGAIQIYSQGSDVTCTNNTIYCFINGNTAGTFDKFAALFIDNYSGDTGVSTVPMDVIVANNVVNATNAYNPFDSTDWVGALFVRTCRVNITGNNINLRNTNVSPGSGPISSLVLDLRPIGSSRSGIVSSNHFGRESGAGALTALREGYINILSTNTVRGTLNGNTFSFPYWDAPSDTDVVVDNSALIYKWLVHSNINQIETIWVNSTHGTFGISGGGNEYTVVGKLNPAGTIDSRIEVDTTETLPETVEFNYNDSGTIVFSWAIPLLGIIPYGANLVDVSVTLDVNTNPATTSNAELTVATLTDDVSTNGTVTTTGRTLTLDLALSSLSDGTRVIGETSPVVKVTHTINHSSTVLSSVGAFVIRYRW